MDRSSHYVIKRSISTTLISIAFLNALKHKYQDLTKDAINNIALGTLLKDIGMMEVPMEIIKKEGPLSLAEFRQIKDHPLKAFDKLKAHKSDIHETTFEVIRYHHEKIDGTGYPYGLVHKKIPFFVLFFFGNI